MKQAMLPQLVRHSNNSLLLVTVVPLSDMGCIICMGDENIPICWVDRGHKLNVEELVDSLREEYGQG